jgi:hypothetical protein
MNAEPTRQALEDLRDAFDDDGPVLDQPELRALFHPMCSGRLRQR